MKFKNSTLNICYQITGNIKNEYSERLNKFCDFIELKILGWTELELLENSEGSEIEAIDVLTKLNS